MAVGACEFGISQGAANIIVAPQVSPQRSWRGAERTAPVKPQSMTPAPAS